MFLAGDSALLERHWPLATAKPNGGQDLGKAGEGALRLLDGRLGAAVLVEAVPQVIGEGFQLRV